MTRLKEFMEEHESLRVEGLVLFNRNRENDKLVKNFTGQAGKRMFLLEVVGRVN